MMLEDLPSELKTENPLSKASLSLSQHLEPCAPIGMNDGLRLMELKILCCSKCILFFSENKVIEIIV